MPDAVSLGQKLKWLSYQILSHQDVENKSQELSNDILEMARVEGYDNSSYVTSLLKDIRRRLSNNESKVAVTKVSKVLEDVMPFDYQLFFNLFKETEATAERLSSKVCWVLLGPTGRFMYIYCNKQTPTVFLAFFVD